jgi:hypothetical protein
MKAQDAEALARCGGDCPIPESRGVGVARRYQTRADMGRLDVDDWIAECGQALAGGAVSGEVAKHPLDEFVHLGALLKVQVATGNEMFGQGTALVAGPGLEGGEELALVDHPDLESHETEEEIAVGIGANHGESLLEGPQ